jgi:hypothetical protein
MRAIVNNVHILFATEIGTALITFRLILFFFCICSILPLKSGAQSSNFSVEFIFIMSLMMSLLVYMLHYRNYT